MKHSCIFCKIINREIPGKIVHETETIIVIQDIAPKAPIHFLIIPKKHIENVLHLSLEDKTLMCELFFMAKQLGDSLKEPKAFNLISNNGVTSGQSVPHLHLHFLSGSSIEKITGKNL
jgi:histidine triad (HIT) family protein